MSANKRATLIGKLHTALKKHYDVAPAQPTRPILEHVLYGSLLEDALSELADEGMAKCEQDFFDWNEVRVTTVTELSQVLSRLPDPLKAAHRLKSNLQAIFEEFYTFDIDHLKKDNLGKAISKFAKMPGMTPFVLNYTVQHGLGGHSIPVDYSAMVILLTTGIATQPEALSGKVPGMERAIPKNKGIEFAGLLHQAGIALNKNSKDKQARAVLDAVAKGSSQQLDDWLASKKAAKKRAVKRKAAAKAAAEAAAIEAIEAAKAAPVGKKKKPAKKKPLPTKRPLPAKPGEKPASPKPSASKPSVAKSAAAKQAAKKKTTAEPKKTGKTPVKSVKPSKAAKVAKAVATKKATAKSKVATKKSVTKKPAKKVASKKKSVSTSSTKKTANKAKPAKKPAAKSKKSANRKLTKRKPR